MEEAKIEEYREEKNERLEWVKQHGKAFAVAGLSISSIVFFTLGIKNGSGVFSSSNSDRFSHTISKCSNIAKRSLCNEVIAIPVCENKGSRRKAPHDVNKHIMNLPQGKKASQVKIDSALENGFILTERQTWVISYRTKDMVG